LDANIVLKSKRYVGRSELIIPIFDDWLSIFTVPCASFLQDDALLGKLIGSCTS